MEIKTTITFEDQLLDDLVCTALEGGSNYWISATKPEGGDYKGKEYGHQVPMAGGTLLITHEGVNEGDPDVKVSRLTRHKLRDGLQLMADEHKKHFANIMEENWDAETADVLIQLAIFRDIIFG